MHVDINKSNVETFFMHVETNKNSEGVFLEAYFGGPLMR